MPPILDVLACVSQCLEPTTRRQLSLVIEALLSMTGRVTMRGISRWTERGGSYRTVQRLFPTSIDWCRLQWTLIAHHLWDQDDVILLAGDDVVVTKSGKQTHGLGRYVSSLYGTTVPSLCFLSPSLLRVNHRTSYPVLSHPLEACHSKQSPEAPKVSSGKVGHPKGRKNSPRHDVTLSPYRCLVQQRIRKVLALIGDHGRVRSFVFDGAFGQNEAVHMVRQTGLHLISKLRHDSALYLPYEGSYAGCGRRKKYGTKLDYRTLPEQYVQETPVDKHIATKIYQMNAWHKKFADLLNIVVIVKTNLKTQKVAHVVLFRTDGDLCFDNLRDSYRLRFQLEFDVRDAKQYWGLEDFMSITSTSVSNSANLAMFMVNVSQAVMRPMRRQWPEMSVLDLKAWFRSQKYVVETLTLLPERPEPIFIDHVIEHMDQLGRINHAVNPV
jgi:putative transposase